MLKLDPTAATNLSYMLYVDHRVHVHAYCIAYPDQLDNKGYVDVWSGSIHGIEYLQVCVIIVVQNTTLELKTVLKFPKQFSIFFRSDSPVNVFFLNRNDYRIEISVTFYWPCPSVTEISQAFLNLGLAILWK